MRASASEYPTPGWINFQSATLGQFCIGGNRRKSIAYASNIKEIIAFVVAYNDRIEILAIRQVAAHYQLSPLVHAHLYPSSRPAAGFVEAIASLRDHSFQALRSHCFCYLRSRRL